MPVIPVTWEAEVGAFQFEAGLGKSAKCVRPYLENKLKAKVLEVWLKS
jgi:hypothetical protein